MMRLKLISRKQILKDNPFFDRQRFAEEVVEEAGGEEASEEEILQLLRQKQMEEEIEGKPIERTKWWKRYRDNDPFWKIPRYFKNNHCVRSWVYEEDEEEK